MFAFFKKKSPPPVIALETSLASLKACGISCATPAIEAAVLENGLPESRLRDDYLLLLYVLGQESRDAPGLMAGRQGNVSDNIWHFDTECIHDHGDYADIARHLALLTKGDLVISEVSDHVDVKAQKAWLSFYCGGKNYKWDLAVNNDWVDETIFSRFDAMLQQTGSARRFIHIDTAGQDCLIGCATQAEKDSLARLPGLDVSWLA